MATCPKVNMACGRKRIPSLLDSGSQVTLTQFGREILPCIIPSNLEKAEAHQPFQLTAANNEMLPVPMYAKLDLDFLRVMVFKVGIPITQEPNGLLHECHKTKLPGIAWNFIKFAYQVFIQKFRQKSFNNLTVQQT